MAHSIILLDEYTEALQGTSGNGVFNDIKTEYHRLDTFLNEDEGDHPDIHEALHETQEWLEGLVGAAGAKKTALSQL